MAETTVATPTIPDPVLVQICANPTSACPELALISSAPFTPPNLDVLSKHVPPALSPAYNQTLALGLHCRCREGLAGAQVHIQMLSQASLASPIPAVQQYLLQLAGVETQAV